ncbi:MAG: hypothetical protein KAG37_06735, partial [Flavobacteriales bacterium]|nr:hypothetical protein [Flavobacteriales bacterium]
RRRDAKLVLEYYWLDDDELLFLAEAEASPYGKLDRRYATFSLESCPTLVGLRPVYRQAGATRSSYLINTLTNEIKKRTP